MGRNIKQVPLLNNPPPLHQALLSPLPSPEVTFLNSRDTRKTCFYFHLIDARINNDSNAIINMQTNTCACVKCVMSLWQKCWINIYIDDVVLRKTCFYFHLIDERINNDSNAIINMQTNTCACVTCVMSLWQKCWINIYIDDVVLSCFSIKNLAKIKLQFIEKKT